MSKLNHRITLNDLPPAPVGKTGWPWTEETSLLPLQRADGIAWPKISIVTPTYNRGDLLEATIRSILLQGYPNLEYLIIDGGSTDNTVQLLKKYEKWITYWVSEKDRGQSHAINKGLAQASGQLLNWLNSDDIYLPKALQSIGEVYHSGTNVGMIFGSAHYVDEHYNIIGTPNLPTQLDYHSFLKNWGPTWIFQPACFFSKEAWLSCGPLDEDLYFCMDTDLFLKIAQQKYEIIKIEATLALALSHQDAKTVAQKEYQAVEHIHMLLTRHGATAEESALFYLKVHLADPLIVARRKLKGLTEHPLYKLFAPVYRHWENILGSVRPKADHASSGNQSYSSENSVS